MKKKKILYFCCNLLLLLVIPHAWGATTNTNSESIIKAIQDVGTKIKAAIDAAVENANDKILAMDETLFSRAETVNENNDYYEDQTLAAATALTQKQLQNQFLQFPEKIAAGQSDLPKTLQNFMDTDSPENSDLIKNLTTLTRASDSLYDTNASYTSGSPSYLKPDGLTSHDEYFTIDSLLQPSGFTDDQATAAKRYVEYLTQPYQSLTDGINFSGFSTALMSVDKKADRISKLNTLVTSPAYQKYQLGIRNYVAAQSVALSNLNLLLGERTRIPNLAKDLDIMTTDEKNTKGKIPSKDASPLEVQNYIANSRIQDPDWYKQITSVSPFVVQRQTVIILAEIESALQRLHLDNERLLATLSVMVLQNNQNSLQILKTTEGEEVNSIIDNLTSSSTSSEDEDEEESSS